jgi:hypothetical protein
MNIMNTILEVVFPTANLTIYCDDLYFIFSNFVFYLSDNELKLWGINNPEYPKSFCLACDNM